MTKVNCSVDSCEFWGQGGICTADAILVKQNMGDEGLYDIEYAEELNLDTAANEGFASETSSQTCCETMRPKANAEDFFDHGPGCR